MILFAVTSHGLADAKAVAARNPGAAIWCSAEATVGLDSGEAGSVPITRFSLPLKGSPHLSMEQALNTIREHHPGEVVWVEAGKDE